MDDYRHELASVKKELAEVEGQLQILLDRQHQLAEKRRDLEAILKQQSEQTNQVDDKKWETKDFAWSKELEEKMTSVFGIRALRPMQLQTMNVTMSGKDCMLIMPTGGGKSLCFQLPAVASKGITLVVSPLVSLMEDQMMALEQLGVEAAMLNAAATKEHVKYVQDAMIDKKAPLKMVYVTPEKLAKSKRFMNRLEKMYQLGRFARLVIDEVHCCSQWGHDFRPDYKFLGIMKRQFPEVPILGLTATATTKVLQDVKKILAIPNCHLFRASFNRPNLYYEVRPKPSAQKDSMDEIQELIKSRFRGQSGIVYCFSRKDAEEVTMELQKRGIKAGCYHGDLSSKERSRVHKLWTASQIHVVVATVAFGMGIDKPDVRFVIHHSLSKSMENLYQESGRAGRDDKLSHCIVFFRFADVFRQSTMVFTEQTGLDNLYGILGYCIDTSRCRRSMIARHFGEVWEASQCNSKCDHCDPTRSATSNKRDVTRHGQNILKILDQAACTDQRVTAIKLIDALYGKGQGSLKVKGLDTMSISREKAERIVAYMLLHAYLKEDFHFTPYSTISYLLPGAKAGQLRSGISNIAMEFESKVVRNNSSSSQGKGDNSATPSSSEEPSPANKKGQAKPKLVIVKSLGHVDSGGDKQTVKKHNSLTKKRKPVIIDSDEDSLDCLAFDDDIVVPAKKKVSRCETFGSSVANGVSSQSQKAILVDDSSDSDFQS
ncbi:ATP-dependent DNA helicase Q1-like isoform X2 [Haliotis rubra]|uniref:ATP-dependent DNA helicase Q1-like isoform X2 n=1 Tax=Haliotis rubra TaxID=36100 RepID=UPI001EE617A3|nr:ATP-dependent DNA helicase Q1-like isoform X2 [Haliotis rubra]